jgi:hypothetical protein
VPECASIALLFQHLAAATYRCARPRERETLAELGELEVTTSHDVLTLQRAS